MAKLPTLRRLSMEDFKDQKSWIGRLLEPLNQFFVSVVSALDNNLTFRDNFAAQVFEVRVQTASSVTAGSGTLPGYVALLSEVKILAKSTLRGRPTMILVGDVVEVADNPQSVRYAVSVAGLWDFANGQIVIRGVTGLEVSKEYRLTCVALGG